MANYFSIDLDTTAPIVTITAPEYIINGHQLDFTAKGDEALDVSLQEAKVYDVSGTLYNVTMTYNVSLEQFEGTIPIAFFVDNIATIEVSLWDLVHNKGTGLEDVKVLRNSYKICLEIREHPHEITVEEVDEC